MAIIPWLSDYPGRVFKKPKRASSPRPKPYAGSPYQYIDLPNPGQLPRYVWENIIKDFDQTLTIRYRTLTSAQLESASDEFKEQPGAIGAGITIDPRKYLDKGVGVVFKDTFRDWLQSVISWDDLDTIIEQRYIWNPLTRGLRNNGSLKPLLEETAPGSRVYKGFDRLDYESFYLTDPKFSPTALTDAENLASTIETWVANGKSKGSRAFPWNQVQRYWLSTLEQSALIGSRGPIDPALYPNAFAYTEDIKNAIVTNTWIAASSTPSGFRPAKENPFYTNLKNVADWGVAETVLKANGFNPRNDEVFFDYQVKESLGKELGKRPPKEIADFVAQNPAGLVTLMQNKAKEVADIFDVREADILALTPAGLSDLLEKGCIEKAKSFYKNKIILPGGQLNILEQSYIFKPGTPVEIIRAARAKHSEVQKKLDFYNREYEISLNSLRRRAVTDLGLQNELRALMGDDKFETLMEWQILLDFRESAFKTQDFLDAAFEDNSLFRTYVWLGKLARDMPDWTGNWGARLKYLTPQFYISGVLTYLDENVLGLASLSKDAKRLMRIPNGAFIPLLKGAVYQRVEDYKNAFKVMDLLDDLVKEGVTVNTVLIDNNARRALFLNGVYGGISLSDLKKSSNPVLSSVKAAKKLLEDSEYTDYLAFLSRHFQDLVNKGHVPAGDVPWLLDRVKSKTLGDKYLYMGPFVAVGRFLDHAQNVFVDKTIAKIPVFKKYADFFKAGTPAFANWWAKSSVGKSLGSLSGKLLTSHFGLIKVLGGLIGSVGGIIAATVAWVGGKILSDIWNLLRGQPAEATKEAIGKLGKVIGIAVVGCCILPMIGFILFLMLIVGGIFNKINEIGQAVTVGSVFDRLTVTKVGTFNPASKSIRYTLTITNVSTDKQNVRFSDDEIKAYPEDCAVPAVKITTGPDPVNGQLVYITMPHPLGENFEMNSSETVVFEYEVRNINIADATYINKAVVQIPPWGHIGPIPLGAADSGVVSKRIDIGEGGCSTFFDLATVASKLAGCLRKGHTQLTYLILDENCVQNAGLSANANCQQALNLYYSYGSMYYPSNLQCVAFANIAVGCYGGRPYYTNGNGQDWFDNANPAVYEKYVPGTGSPPPAGAILVFSSASGGGHTGIVTQAPPPAGGFVVVTMVGSNTKNVEYYLNFNTSNVLVDPLSGLTYIGYLVVR